MARVRRVTAALRIPVVFAAAACGEPDAGRPAAETGVPTAAPGAAPAPARYDEHVFAGGVAPPAGVLENPFAGDGESAAEGERIFVAMNCDGCHGGGAVGVVGPSLVDGRWRYGGDDAAVFHSIFYGRPAGMPAYGGLLPHDGIWKIVAYIRSRPLPDNVPTESWR